MKKKIKVIKQAIEEDPWDEKVEDSDDFLNYISWIAIILAAVYFGPIVIGILAR